jgi:hypothetical protein
MHDAVSEFLEIVEDAAERGRVLANRAAETILIDVRSALNKRPCFVDCFDWHAQVHSEGRRVHRPEAVAHPRRLGRSDHPSRLVDPDRGRHVDDAVELRDDVLAVDQARIRRHAGTLRELRIPDHDVEDPLGHVADPRRADEVAHDGCASDV